MTQQHGSEGRGQIEVTVSPDEEGVAPEDHYKHFGKALQKAVDQAADAWGPGNHGANVHMSVVFKKTNPGEIIGYKIILG